MTRWTSEQTVAVFELAVEGVVSDRMCLSLSCADAIRKRLTWEIMCSNGISADDGKRRWHRELFLCQPLTCMFFLKHLRRNVFGKNESDTG